MTTTAYRRTWRGKKLGITAYQPIIKNTELVWESIGSMCDEITTQNERDVKRLYPNAYDYRDGSIHGQPVTPTAFIDAALAEMPYGPTLDRQEALQNIWYQLTDLERARLRLEVCVDTDICFTFWWGVGWCEKIGEGNHKTRDAYQVWAVWS